MRLAVIGHPIAHSLSPMLHTAWLEAAGLFGCYTALDVEPGRLDAVIRRLRDGELDGLNVTIPHKEAIIPYLDRLEESASRAGAVNTVYRIGNELIGANTDGSGFVKSLERTGHAAKDILVIGAGGAARGIISALGTQVTVANRTYEHALRLAAEFDCEARPLDAIDLKGFDTIINTTPVGMSPNIRESPPVLDGANALVCDTLSRPTPSLPPQEAPRLGVGPGRVVPGLTGARGAGGAASSARYGAPPRLTRSR